MQMYMVVIGGYYLYKSFAGKKDAGHTNADESSATMSEHADADAPSADVNFTRRFTQVDGSWLSYVEARYVEARSRTGVQLLLLHRTSLSAEAEFGTTIPQLVANVA